MTNTIESPDGGVSATGSFNLICKASKNCPTWCSRAVEVAATMIGHSLVVTESSDADDSIVLTINGHPHPRV